MKEWYFSTEGGYWGYVEAETKAEAKEEATAYAKEMLGRAVKVTHVERK